MNYSLNSNDDLRQAMLKEEDINSISIDFLNKADFQVPNNLVARLKTKEKEEKNSSFDLFTKTESNRNNSFVDPTQKGTKENKAVQIKVKKMNNRSNSVKIIDNVRLPYTPDMSSTFVSFITPQKKIKKISKEEVNQTVHSMLTRFKEKQEQTDKKIKEMKRKVELEEFSNLKSKPQITRSSSVNFKFQNEKFIERNQKYYEMSQIKKEKLREQIEKKKEKEEVKINPKLNKKKPPRAIKENVESILKWKEKKNEKLYQKKSQLEKQNLKGCTFKPIINNNSKKIADAQKEMKAMSSTILTERISDISTLTNNHDGISSRTIDERTNKIKELKHNLSNLTTTTNAPNAECSPSPIRLARSRSEIKHNQGNREELVKLFQQNKKLKFVTKDEIKNLSAREAKIMEEILKGKIKIV